MIKVIPLDKEFGILTGSTRLLVRFRHLCDSTSRFIGDEIGHPVLIIGDAWGCGTCRKDVPDKILFMFKLWRLNNG